MNHISRSTILALVAFATVRQLSVTAQDPAKFAATIAPYVDDQTMVVARIDLTRIDVDAAVKFLHPVVAPGETFKDVETNVKIMKAKLAEMKRLGGGEVFFVGSLDEFPDSFGFLIATVRVPNGAALIPGHHQHFAGLLFSGKSGGPTKLAAGEEPAESIVSMQICEQINDALFAGTKSMLRRIKARKPVARPELAKAFEAAGDTDMQLLLIPTDDHRRVLREMMPRLPNELGGGSGRVVADGLRWIAVGINAPPRPQLSCVIQLRDAESAGLVKGVLSGIYLEFARTDLVRNAVPVIDEVLAALTPETKNSQLRISIGEGDKRLAAILRAFAPPVGAVAAESRRRKSVNNMRQIALAFHNFYDGSQHLPAVENIELKVRPGKAKHPFSWRVAILPFIEHQDLFNQYNFDEPWDSDHNRQLIAKMPNVFNSPNAGPRKDGKTVYQVPVGKDTVFSEKGGIKFAAIKDGTSNTIMLVETHPSRAVIWTKPEDFEVDDEDPLKGLKGQESGGFITAFCDGSSHLLPDKIDLKKLRALFTKNGGESVSGF